MSAKAGRLYFAGVEPKRGESALVEDHDERIDAVRETVARFVRGMQEGRFDLQPTHACPSYCPYRRICHFSPARADIKAAPPHEGAPE